ncbi:MAG TPA: hypothetical protein VHD32_08235 [Candidatus Didemnitutus sp.]|nr:hypothetical protein [Candidatus Didemnitutus sp.]
MKLSRFLLSLAALGLVTVSVSAATSTNDEVVRLPVYRIDVPRHSDAELAIARSLKAVADQALVPMAVQPVLPVLTTAQKARSTSPAPVRVARF